MTDENKKCPMCAEAIPLEAAACEYCGAQFAISSSGYCAACHELREADADGRCSVCGAAVADRHVDSKFLGEAEAAPPASPAVSSSPEKVSAIPTGGVQPSIAPRKKTGLLWISGIGLVVLCVVGITGAAALALMGAFSIPSTPSATPSATNMPVAVSTIKPTDTQPVTWVEWLADSTMNDVQKRDPNFADDFSNPDGSTAVWTDLGQDVAFTDGVLRFQVKEEWSQAGGPLDASDFVLEFDVTPTTLSEEVSFGVDFRIHDKGWRYLAFNPIDTWIGIGAYENDEWVKDLAGVELNLYSELGKTHRIDLIVKEGEYALLIDGSPVLYAIDESPTEDGWCHLWAISASGLSVIDVDNVRFWDLNNLNP